MVIRKDKSKFGHTSIFRKVEFLKSMKSEVNRDMWILPLLFRVLRTFSNTVRTLDKRNRRILWGPELSSRDLKLENTLFESRKN